MKKLIAAMMALAMLPMAMNAQGNIHERSTQYEWPQDEQVVSNLKAWQDLKFGVLFHWGLYAVPGIVESWSICDEDWITRDSTCTYQQYMDWYFGLADELRPTQFDATQWAQACQDAGMRYMIFTTKHHDGFCMWDTKQTDFSIAHHAFRDDPRRDVLRHVLDAFRAKNFTVGTYFSKPDWHSQLYWWDTYGKKGRNVNYPIKQHPERWQKFVKYTHNQIEELMTNYGKVDILWLDGGWVAAENRGQDIDMPGMARMARSHQPGLIIVDRTIHGPYENYQTPERTIPEEQLPYPWESCIPLSDDWGFVNRPRWKSPQRVVNTLVEIVAKGGNLVLGVGPTPEGLIQPEAVSRLKSIGQWLNKNGRAIYSTTTTPRYHDGSLWFTAAKDGSAIYAIYTLAEEQPMPTEVTWTGNIPAKGVRLLSTGKKLKTKVVGDQVTVTLPKQLPQESFALELRMK